MIKNIIKNGIAITAINPNTPNIIAKGSQNKQKHHHQEMLITPVILSIQSNAVINRGHPPTETFTLLSLII